MQCTFSKVGTPSFRSNGAPAPRCWRCAVRARRGGGGYFDDQSLIRQSGMNMGGQSKFDFGAGQGRQRPNDILQNLDLGSAIDLAPVGDAASEPSPINYDPEGLFKNPTTLQDGHIARRTLMKKMEQGEEMEKALKAEQEKELEAAQQRRESTEIPMSVDDLVEFFLTRDTADMEYFVAKCRPMLTDAFFVDLDNRIGQLRFLAEDEQEGLDELIGLREYIRQFIAAQDSVNQGVLSVTERLKKLLTAKDKKQMILDMAAANEIDVALVSLLEQNISTAEAAGQVQAAEFMTKVKNACSKYLIAPASMSEEEKVRAALAQQKQAEEKKDVVPSMPKLIIPR